MKMEAFDRLKFHQNYKQRYTVISITTVRGPLMFMLLKKVNIQRKCFIFLAEQTLSIYVQCTIYIRLQKRTFTSLREIVQERF